MPEPGSRTDVLGERGAVLVIVGCVFLYLAYLAEVRYQGEVEPAHRMAGIFVLYAAWTLATGFLGLLERPLSTPMAGASYAVGGWFLAAGAARTLVQGSGLGGLLVVAVVGPLVVVAQSYGVALGRGVERPTEEDTLVARFQESLASFLGRTPRGRT